MLTSGQKQVWLSHHTFVSAIHSFSIYHYFWYITIPRRVLTRRWFWDRFRYRYRIKPYTIHWSMLRFNALTYEYSYASFISCLVLLHLLNYWESQVGSNLHSNTYQQADLLVNQKMVDSTNSIYAYATIV